MTPKQAAFKAMEEAKHGFVSVPIDDYKKMLESMESDDSLIWCETCGAWLTSDEAATTEDYQGCWKMATGGKMDADKCKSYRALTLAKDSRDE